MWWSYVSVSCFHMCAQHIAVKRLPMNPLRRTALAHHVSILKITNYQWVKSITSTRTCLSVYFPSISKIVAPSLSYFVRPAWDLCRGPRFSSNLRLENFPRLHLHGDIIVCMSHKISYNDIDMFQENDWIYMQIYLLSHKISNVQKGECAYFNGLIILMQTGVHN